MSQGAITLADIVSADWSLMLDSTAGGGAGSGIGNVVQGLADVDQCIAIILTTPKGGDPLRPTFGADIWRYIDFPIDEALPAIVREITDAITAWEPRVRLLSVSAAPVLDSAAQSGAQLAVTVVWQLKLVSPPAAPSRTQVVIPSGPL
jgi:phage baseplate assembly protein W